MSIRRVKTTDANQENLFPLEIQQPEPVGTYILVPYKIVGYIRDANGNVYAETIQVDLDGNDLQEMYKGVILDLTQQVVVDHPSNIKI